MCMCVCACAPFPPPPASTNTPTNNPSTPTTYTHHQLLQVKMAFGGPNRVDGRLLALLRTMYCRDRRLLAVSNVTYEVC